ncbi:MAG: creatininase family protein [Alphaproteobacteria bacterium]|nr:creatininase family protein [Alphaproteobacteria bacterium]
MSQLQLATWPEVESYLARSTGIIIPIGSTEQHGPNGLIGTDALTAEMVARAVGETVGALVAPTISVGMAQHHLGFPGSITLRPSTLMAVIVDHVASLARHGFDRFFFVNGHGGNIATTTAAFSEIYAERSLHPAGNRPGVRCKLRNWWEGPETEALCKTLYGDALGSHATPSEVAMTWHGFPHAIKHATMAPRIAPTGAFHDADDYRSRFPDGRIGSDPTLATAADGARILDIATREVAADYRAFVEEA